MLGPQLAPIKYRVHVAGAPFCCPTAKEEMNSSTFHDTLQSSTAEKLHLEAGDPPYEAAGIKAREYELSKGLVVHHLGRGYISHWP